MPFSSFFTLTSRARRRRQVFAIVLLLGGLLVALWAGLFVRQEGPVTLSWLNMAALPSTTTTWGWMTVVGLIWVGLNTAAFLVTGSVGVLVTGGLLLAVMLPDKVAVNRVLEIGGFTFRLSLIYWLTAAFVVAVTAFPWKRESLLPAVPGSRILLVAVVVGAIALIHGSARGQSGYFQFSAYVELLLAFHMTASWVRSRQGIRQFLVMVGVVGLVKGVWSF